MINKFIAHLSTFVMASGIRTGRISQTEKYIDLDCEDDDYVCLRRYYESPYLQSILDVRDLNTYFEKYRDDTANYSLYIWGSVMPLMKYYAKNGMVIPPEEPISLSWHDETAFDDSLFTLFGEEDVYPKFVEHRSFQDDNQVSIYVLYEAGADLFSVLDAYLGNVC